MKILAQGKYIKVVDPESNVTITGLKLLKVTMTCACCNHDVQSFEIMSDRLDEWTQMLSLMSTFERIKNEKKFQPLCKSCVKAHNKWHPEQDKLKTELKEFAKELWEEYQLLLIPSKEGPVYRKVFDRLTKILGLETDWMLLASLSDKETKESKQ